MEKRITFYPPQTWRGRFLGTILTLVALLLGATQVKAQDVLIDPVRGSLVSSVTNQEETGFKLGLGALWRHEQLALSLNATDRDDITPSGEVGTPSAVLGIRQGSDGVKRLTIIGGRRPSFLVVSLPKGYRITGYEIVLVNDLVGSNANVVPPGVPTTGQNAVDRNFTNINSGNELSTNDVGTATMRFYETTAWKHNETNSRDQQYWNNGNPNGSAMARYINEGTTVDATSRQIGSTILNRAKRTDDESDININPGDAGKEFKMSRFSNDMGNQLYFRLVKNYFFYGITIKSFRIWFTAEGDFDAPVKPIEADYARRVVMSGFKTNKLDIGKMQPQAQAGSGNNAIKYFSYDYHNVKDLDAYNYIYQERAVKDGVPYEREKDDNGTDIDAHITPVTVDGKNLFAFENDTFYVEPPISIHTSSGLEAPIGYRIVGAKIEYLWGPDGGTSCTKLIPNGFYIIYNHITEAANGAQNVTPYYLNSSLQFATYGNNPPLWHMTDNGDIYYGNDDSNFLSCKGEGSSRTLSWSDIPNSRFNLRTDDDGGHIYYYSDGLNYYNVTPHFGNNGLPSAQTALAVKDAMNYLAVSDYQAGGHTVEVSSFTPGEYDLNIFNQKTGKTIDSSKSVHVTKALATGENNYVTLEDLNNDAIKFSISNLAEGKKALLNITLQLQALDPYISSMKVECKNLPKQLQMSQTFSASNFSVSGGSFIFYVPSDLVNETMNISFADLYSDYGDKTYWGEDLSIGKARYSFVTSDYFYPINGNGNLGLYSTAYNPDAPFENKVYTATAGNVRYKFNNAEDLNASISEGAAYLEEYPFSVKTYLNNYDDPDFDPKEAEEGETATKAKFELSQVKAGNGEQEAGSFFVFTADETRYNIAPTTDWQHRFYAFYRMDVKAVAKSYYPYLEWTKVYDNALYLTEDEDGNEVKGEDAQFGLKLKTKEIITNDDGTTTIGDFAIGYLTVKEIEDAISAAITAELANKTGDVPTSKNQILYIDGSDLKGIYNYIKTEDGQPMPATLETLKEGLGANALIFLPQDITSTLDNYVTKTEANTFLAGNNIVLTDKQPFYTPYNIQMNPANSVSYKRMISDDLNGQATLATIMLPFKLTIDKNGVHTNPADAPTGKFSLNFMSEYDEDGEPIDMKNEKAGVDYGTAYFTPLVNNTATAANTPYMLKVEDTSAGEDANFSFVVAEKNAEIIATPTNAVVNNIGTGKLHVDNSTVSVKYGSDSYTFTNKATFSGAKFDRAKSEDVFYFANNKYLDLHTLQKYKDNIQDEAHLQQYLYIYPFRGVYTYTRTAGTSGAKRMQWFNISFDEPTHGVATDITNVSDADLIVKTGKGIVTMTATRSQDVNINTLSGMSMKRVDLNAGDTKTVNLPAGVYMINNVKVIVK